MLIPYFEFRLYKNVLYQLPLLKVFSRNLLRLLLVSSVYLQDRALMDDIQKSN